MKKKSRSVLVFFMGMISIALLLGGMTEAAPPEKPEKCDVCNELATVDQKVDAIGTGLVGIDTDLTEIDAELGTIDTGLASTLEKLYAIDAKLDLLPCGGAPVTITGQTTSYATGDDGDLQKGVSWPYPRFRDHEDGTVTDRLTDLMWTKDANIYGLYGGRTWTEALSDCASCTEGGYSDWRLPNVRELLSLVDYGRDDPLPAGHPFDKVTGPYYWSSTTDASRPSDAWHVGTHGGLGSSIKDSGSYVWCVRGGH